MKADPCQGTTQDGKPCGARPRPGSVWCPWHDPDLKEQHRAWSAKGGQQRSNGNRARKKLAGDLRDLVGVKAMLLESMQQTKDGTMEPGILTALSTAARAVVAVAGVADFEEQLGEMRREIADLAEHRSVS